MIGILLIVPALVALALLALSIWLLAASGTWSKGARFLAWTGAIGAMLGAFGIGACYAVMMQRFWKSSRRLT